MVEKKISYTSELTHHQLDIFRVGILVNTGRKKTPLNYQICYI